MFWRFDLHPTSAIDTILTREVSLHASWVKFYMQACSTAHLTQPKTFVFF